MRTVPALLLLLGVALAAPACAQAPDVVTFGPGLTQTAPTVAPALPIPVPPGVVVQVEMDGRDGDLLGMVKSLLAGAASPKTNARTQAGANANPFAAFLGDGQLTALLKDIHHLHVLSFKTAEPPAAGGQTDFLAFYEKPFEAEGGHRLLYLSEQKVVTVGFDQPRGFAAVVQSSGTVFVVRADGYPDMTVIGNLLRTFGSAIPTSGLLGVTPTPVPAAPPAHKATPKKAVRARARRA